VFDNEGSKVWAYCLDQNKSLSPETGVKSSIKRKDWHILIFSEKYGQNGPKGKFSKNYIENFLDCRRKLSFSNMSFFLKLKVCNRTLFEMILGAKALKYATVFLNAFWRIFFEFWVKFENFKVMTKKIKTLWAVLSLDYFLLILPE
jgi:hypothetical protein